MVLIHRVLPTSSLRHLSTATGCAKSFPKSLPPFVVAAATQIPHSLPLTNASLPLLHPSFGASASAAHLTTTHSSSSRSSIFTPSLLLPPKPTTTTFALVADDEMLPAFRRLGLASFTSSVAAAAATPRTTTLLARTYSSSSRSPADGSSSRAVPPAVASSGSGTTPRTSTKRLLSGGGIPFVPSTDHLHPADIALSTFFAEHRPISIAPTSTPPTAMTPPPQHIRVISKHDPSSPWEFGIPFQPPGPPEEMLAISVKRQRKLKMKKHKYKKLMKKTRNARRRIERQKN
ncbi:hypothetical protein BZA05DRAFT_277895 [Tricharina praecox]|uniref:uncharacterized protein n=1 Tax=Tricharina praecox TaxID=43433 RepID=UPI0022205B96|nr:uncharacterized protein BZA05DRAFT_277895 [Tricharina praecox]KAI5854036.1 hypothetical protein BZA05DRAFT_277895 [Tricharina praecox]